MRGYPVTLRGAVAFPSRDSVRLDALRLDSAANHVVLTGTLDRTSTDLVVDAELDQLDLLVPDVTGALNSAFKRRSTARLFPVESRCVVKVSCELLAA